VGNEKGIAGYPCWSTMPHRGGRTAHDTESYTQLLPNGDPEGVFWTPAMCDVPLRNHSWFWHPDQDHLLYSTDALVDMYDKSVGRNAFLTLGAVIDSDGLVPEPDTQRCIDFGTRIARSFSQLVGHTSGKGNSIELRFPKSSLIDQIVIMEDIAQGERIRKYHIEGKNDSRWKTLCEGISVGHKRIQKFSPVRVEMIRLVCTESSAEPLILSLAVYKNTA
jgi:alpha-L-fucosidase